MMIAHPTNTYMTRNLETALEVEREWKALIGRKISSFGRITDTLTGVEIKEVEFSGRPLFQVIPQIHNHDPLFDA